MRYPGPQNQKTNILWHFLRATHHAMLLLQMLKAARKPPSNPAINVPSNPANWQTSPARKAALPSPSLSSDCLLRHKLLAFYRTSLVEMPAYAESTVYSARICANIAIENTHSPLVQEHSAHFLPAVCADLLPGHKASAVGCNLVNFVGESSSGCLPEFLNFVFSLAPLYFKWYSRITTPWLFPDAPAPKSSV